mgnify:CR=1 FL=1
MVNNSDIYIHFITIFLIFLFIILYSLNILLSNKINIYYKIISLIILFSIINLTFNLISKNLLYYREFICNFNKKKINNFKNKKDYIIYPYNNTNYAKY